MSKGVVDSSKRGRGRPRKQDFTVREPCDAPVIELTSSSDEDEPPPRPPIRKPQQVKPSQKPPILVKRTPVHKPTTRVITALPMGKEKKSKTLTDNEALLSILESNADDLESLSDLKEDKRTQIPGGERLSDKKDNLFRSIEEELRSLHQLDDDMDDTQLDPSKPRKVAEKRRSVEIIDEIKADLRKMKDTDDLRKSSAVPSVGSDVVIRRVKTDKNVVSSRIPGKEELKKEGSEVTRIHRFDSDTSPSKLKLPPEVLQAIKKRANLGRIEKIVEKTDSNKKSKYIVIFNKGSNTPKKKSSIEEEIEELLKSLPEKPPPAKKVKTLVPKDPIASKTKYYKPTDFSDVKSKFTKLLEPKDRSQSYRISDVVSKTKLSALESQKGKGVRFPSAKGIDPDWQDVTSTAKKTPTRPEEPVRFTESPLSHEPPLPWDRGNDDEKNFEKYFKISERVVENHDSMDSESEYEDPEMLSHFKNLNRDKAALENKERANDAINVSNIANTIAREFPGWNAEPLPGTNTICLVRLGLDAGGFMSVRKQIKIDSEYNVSVIANNISIPEYEGLYDSFDNIKQLVREIDQL